MAPKADVSEERRNQILDAAKKTFARRGFHKTRMADIAETSGLSKGSLYWYFESKDAIIQSLLEKAFEPEIKELESLLTDDRSAEEKLLHYVERSGQDIIEMLKWMPLLYDFIALAFRQEKIKNIITGFYQKHMQLLTTLVQQGMDAGEYKDGDCLDVAIAIGSIIEGTVMLWIYAPDQIDIVQHIQSNIQLLLAGIRA